MNKSIIVTGGTGNLGSAIVRKFTQEGFTVFVPVASLIKFKEMFDTSQREENYRINKIFAFECDATNSSSVRDFIQSVKRLATEGIEGIVNTVGGIHSPVKIENVSDELLDKYWHLNFVSSFNFTREILPWLKEQKKGTIIYTSAKSALTPLPERFVYWLSKSSLLTLAEAVRIEYHDFNIDSYTLLPGIIDTPENRSWGTEEEIKSWVKPETIAEIVFKIFSKSEVFDKIIKL
jgi:NAD(P)-dependent dehydrogenase (short-subunit alcohol dehydrogenase family)